MRLFHEVTESYLGQLLHAVQRDPASFANWLCLWFTPPVIAIESPQSRFYIRAIRQAEGLHPDGDMVICPDQSLLFICRNLPSAALHQLAKQWHELAASIADSTAADAASASSSILNLADSWELLQQKLRPYLSASQTAAHTWHGAAPNFASAMASTVGQIDLTQLRSSFAAACRLRSTRATPCVLVVEDEPFTRRLLSQSLKGDYAIITASTAAEALLQYFTQAPDITLLDLHLPDHSGMQLLQTLTAQDPAAFIVITSGNSYLDNVTTALNLGAKGFLAKPVNPAQIKSYIALHQAQAASG